MKTENVSPHAELAVNFWGPSSNTFISTGSASSEIITGTKDWTNVHVQVEAPKDAKYLRVEARLYGSGTVWADDIFVEDLSRNRAPNAGFESDPKTDYLTLATDFTKNEFTQATDAIHSGGKSLKIVSTQPYGEYSGWLSKNDAISVLAGRLYRVDAWVKTKGVGGRAELAANFWGAGGGSRITTGGKTSSAISGDQDWKKITLTVQAPTDAYFVKTEMRLFGSGTVWFDDLSVIDLSVLPKYDVPLTPLPTVTPIPTPSPTPSTGTSSEPQPNSSGQAPATPSGQGGLPAQAGVTITRWLIVGTIGEDVKLLQEHLKSLGYFPQEQETTTYFGSITRGALRKFQCAKLNVCSGDEESTGYGATGPKTRRALGLGA